MRLDTRRERLPARGGPHERGGAGGVDGARAPCRRAQLSGQRRSVAVCAGAEERLPCAGVVDASNRCRHPHGASRCRQEVVAAIGATAHASYNDVQTQLPLCTAVINETLRLYPPAPVTVRYTETPVELMPGVVVPPGSTLYLPIWWIHRSPHNFDEPDVFRPERFLGSERDRKHHRYSFIPFSGGARDCVGRRFAMIEAVAVFAHVIRNVDFEVRCDHEVITQAVGPVQKPKGGMPLRVRAVNVNH